MAGVASGGRILLVRLGSLGDVILATAAATRLKQRRPGVEIGFVTRAACAPVLFRHPDIDKVIVLNAPGNERRNIWTLAAALRQGEWDGVIDLHANLRSRLLTALLRVPRVTRYHGAGLRRRLLVQAPRLSRKLGLADRPFRVVEAYVDAVDRHLSTFEKYDSPDATRPVGTTPPSSEKTTPGRVASGESHAHPTTPTGRAEPDDRGHRGGRAEPGDRGEGVPLPSVHLAPAELKWAEREIERLGIPRHAVALCPGAKHPTKRWPVEYYAEVIDRLAVRSQAVLPVFLSTSREDGEVEAALRRAVRRPEALRLIRQPLRRAAALLSRCGAVVTNDSGLMHLAAALEKPVVALFGPTVAAFGFFPAGRGHQILERQLDCRPCSLHGGSTCPEKHFRCLREISPEDVLLALEKIDLHRKSQRREGA